MQAGRELDAKVAEALGWHWGDTGQGLEGLFPPEGDLRYNIALYGPLHFDKEGYLETMPHYSTSWNGMGVLVEEARRNQDILLDYDTYMDAFVGRARSFEALSFKFLCQGETAPHALCMAFLKLKSAAI